MNDELISAYEVARRLNVSHTTVYNWIEKGVPYHEEEIGLKTVKYFRMSEVEHWIEERKAK